MSVQLLDLLLDQSEQLTQDEQLVLATRLIERARHAAPTRQRRKWSEICGLSPYPLTGEDAQAWVTRARRAGDEQRAQQWGHAL